MHLVKKVKRLFRRKLKVKLIEGEYPVRLIEAFRFDGEVYYMHEDPLTMCTGRGLSSMVFMEELHMRMDTDFVKRHCKAVDTIFSDPKKTDIKALILLNENMKQRLALLIALPDAVYKLASVVFFTEHESPFKYDDKANERKIEKWKQAPDMYGFFLQTPLNGLIPYLQMPNEGTQDYLRVVEKMAKTHSMMLSSIISKST